MNLNLIEDYLLRQLQQRLGATMSLHSGPLRTNSKTGLQEQVFVHADPYRDDAQSAADQLAVGRRAWEATNKVAGFREHRPATIDINVSCISNSHSNAVTLASEVSCTVLRALESMAPPLLSNSGDNPCQLRFVDFSTALHQQSSSSLSHGDELVAAMCQIRFRLYGFALVEIVQRGGLPRVSVFDLPLKLAINPGSGDAASMLKTEHVIIMNGANSAVSLGGWTLAAKTSSTRKLLLPATLRIGPSRSFTVWSSAGSNDANNHYWRLRGAIWQNNGDIAQLVDPDGVERAKAEL